MSVWGTSGPRPHAEAFLGRRDHRISGHKGPHRHASPHHAPGFAWGRGHTLDQGKPPPRPATRPRHSTRSTPRRPTQTHASPHTPKGMGTNTEMCVRPGGRLSVKGPVREYQPVHPFDYACRPRLRTRLTQGRRTWPWNPWSSSGKDPHLALATHVCILTPIRSTTGSLRGFNPAWDALLPNNHKGRCRVFGGVLEPRYIVGAEPLDQ